MKFLQTKHERNSAKITTLIILIISLLVFVVGPQYFDEPIEYGVAINFGEPSAINAQSVPDMPSKSEEIIEDTETDDVSPESEDPTEDLEDVSTEEEVVEEPNEEQTDSEAEEQARQEELAQKQAEAERLAKELLEEQEAEAERLKAEEEAKEKAEAQRVAAEKAKAEKEARESAEREAKAAKAAKEKAEHEAKAKAAREAKERADREARAKAAKAEADRKAAAAAAANKNKSGGSDVVGFALVEEAPIYPGCEGLDNEARKNCMSTKVTQFVTSRFNKELASTLGFTGTQRIRINFRIDKTGKVIGIRANAADPKLKEEAERITKLLPRLKPGIQQGKAVTVPYAVTVRFKAKE